VTVYVVVTVGVNDTPSLIPPDQVYASPEAGGFVTPEPLNVTVSPAQISTSDPAFTIGDAVDTTSTVPLLLQPLPSVPVTVYVVVVEPGGTKEAPLEIAFPETSTPDQL
jgi:hypothetical protein